MEHENEDKESPSSHNNVEHNRSGRNGVFLDVPTSSRKKNHTKRFDKSSSHVDSSSRQKKQMSSKRKNKTQSLRGG